MDIIPRYAFTIFWSEEDNSYICICPSFPGLSACGDTEEEALKEAKVARDLFVASYKEHGEQLPEA